MLPQKTHPTRFIVTTLVVVLLVASQTAQSAFAGLIQCRSDPLILLSDGTVVDVSASIDALLWDVEEVRYVVHIPAGLSVVAAVSTPNWPTTIERFVVYADKAPGQFSTTTTVFTRQNDTPVTATMIVNLIVKSKSGKSGQALPINISLSH